MWARSRCSILFHLLVPGGRCATVTARPVSSAKRCSSRFHSRTRAPLLPPQSAVMWNIHFIDATVVRAHQHAAGARRDGGTGEEAQAREALGRSQGGFTTKVHLRAEG